MAKTASMTLNRYASAYVCFTLSVVFFHQGSVFGGSIFNYVSFGFALLGLLLAGEPRPVSALVVSLICALLYVLYPPKSGLVSLAPLVALAFVPRLGEVAIGRASGPVYQFPLFAAVLTTFVAFAASDPSAPFRSFNLLSVIYLYLIFTQIIFYGAPQRALVIFAVIIAFLVGNKSGLVLLLFLFRRPSLSSNLAIAGFAVVAGFAILGQGLSQFGRHSDWEDEGYLDPRLLMSLESLAVFRGEGLMGFIARTNFEFVAAIGDSDFYDFHNSWLRLLYYEHFVGMFKLLLAALSMLVLPFYWAMAIAIRATFDSFFLSNPIDIVFLMLFVKHLRRAVAKWPLPFRQLTGLR